MVATFTTGSLWNSSIGLLKKCISYPVADPHKISRGYLMGYALWFQPVFINLLSRLDIRGLAQTASSTARVKVALPTVRMRDAVRTRSVKSRMACLDVTVEKDTLWLETHVSMVRNCYDLFRGVDGVSMQNIQRKALILKIVDTNNNYFEFPIILFVCVCVCVYWL